MWEESARYGEAIAGATAKRSYARSSMKKNILVFPCGSEIALEIFRSLNKSTHFNLIGANSVADHGKFVFEQYIEDVPFVSAPGFVDAMKRIAREYSIDFIYPAMDSVITALKENEDVIGCPVVASPVETTKICLSKSKTYEALAGVVRTPRQYHSADTHIPFPVFCKPDVGYGSRGAKMIETKEALRQHLQTNPSSLVLEYLPGEEYTVDCFTNRHGELLFCGPRVRNRISNGISVNTFPVEDNSGEFRQIVEKINAVISFCGAWFVQLKRDTAGNLTLLEIACRLGGSSALFRARGVNFAQLSLFDAMDCDVSIVENKYSVEMDRALDNKFKLDLKYDEVFIDYDDTMILDAQRYNTTAMQFLYQCKNTGIKVTLLSSHTGNLLDCLERYHLTHLFDRVIHIEKAKNKADFIDNSNSIFIDDSFSERRKVKEGSGIPVISVDMIDMLIK
jgi:hypothetical protein